MISARLAARPLLADGLLAAVVLAFQLWLEFGLYEHGPDLGAALSAALTACALVFRRRYPLLVIAFVMVVACGAVLLGHKESASIAAVLIGVYSASARGVPAGRSVLVVLVLAAGTTLPLPDLEDLRNPTFCAASSTGG